MPVFYPAVQNFHRIKRAEREKLNAELLVLTGTEQPTAEEAITEINATLAEALTGKGVEAEATETTEKLASKVGQITDFISSNATSISFGYVDLYDDTMAKNVPNLYLARVTSCQGLFYNNKVTQTVGDIYAPNSVAADSMFKTCFVQAIGKIQLSSTSTVYANSMCQNSHYLESIEGIVGKMTDIRRAFEGCSKLKKIGGELDFSGVNKTGTGTSQAFYATFTQCSSLEEIGFVEGSIPVSISFAPCPNLSDESVQSIIDGLADLTGETTQTLTLHATVKAKLTDEQIATITGKNWTLA